MFAIAFDMFISDLKMHYGEPYNNAYFEIGKVLRDFRFYNTQGSLYLSEEEDMGNLYMAIDALRKIDWFRKSVRDIRAFKVENWSDFTAIVKSTP
jgi:virulence-associated protein VapD